MTTPLLAVPGLNCTARVYADILPALWTDGPVTIADHRHGSTMAQIAAAILETAPPRFALAGYSMGGYIAFEILRQAPQRVEKLLLLDTQAAPDTPEQSEARRKGIELTRQGKYQTLLTSRYSFIVHTDNLGDEALRRTYVDMALDLGPETFIRHTEAIIARPDSRPDLTSIRLRTLIVCGEADQITPPQASREMAEAISGAQLTFIDGAGHLAPLERPGAYGKAIAEWLAR